MIVQCPQCRTRFRVADDKVPDKGVKVRCTKCANVFKVTRADAVDAKPAGRDEFGLGLDTPRPPDRDSLDLGFGDPAPAPATPPPPRVQPNLPQSVSLTYGGAGGPVDLDNGRAARPAAPPRAMPTPAPLAPPPRPPPAADPFADFSAPPPPRPAAAADDPFAEMDFGAAAPPPPYVAPAPLRAQPTPAPVTAPPALHDPFADDLPAAPAPAPRPAVTDDPFAVPSQAAELSDPFAGVEHSLGPAARPAPAVSQPTPGLHQPPVREGFGTGREFDLQESTSEPRLDLDYTGALPEAPRREPVELARIQLSTAAPTPAKPAPVDPAEAARVRVKREVATAAFNVLSALVVGLAGLVTIAAIRAPRPLTLDDAGFNIVWLAIGADEGRTADALHATRVFTGTYVTRGGRELFYVTGEVANDSSAAREAVQVAVELRQDGRLVGRAESVAGLAAGPEQLFTLDSGRNDELQKALAQTATGFKLPPRTKAPFLAVFPLEAKEVEGSDVHLTVTDGLPAVVKAALPTPAPAPAPVQAIDGGTAPGAAPLEATGAVDGGAPAIEAGKQ